MPEVGGLLVYTFKGLVNCLYLKCSPSSSFKTFDTLPQNLLPMCGSRIYGSPRLSSPFGKESALRWAIGWHPPAVTSSGFTARLTPVLSFPKMFLVNNCVQWGYKNQPFLTNTGFFWWVVFVLGLPIHQVGTFPELHYILVLLRQFSLLPSFLWLMSDLHHDLRLFLPTPTSSPLHPSQAFSPIHFRHF